MIIVKVKKGDSNIRKIIISGHACYDKYGKDIICASVSSILTTTVNGILSIATTIKYKYESDKFYLDVIKKDDITNKLLLNMIYLLNELESDYPKNIKILEEE